MTNLSIAGMIRWVHLALLCACGAAPMSAAPTAADRKERPAPGPQKAPERDAGATAAPAPHCHATADRAAVLPSGFTIPATQQVCDLEDRIILVDKQSVTVLTRPLLQRTQAPIARTEHLGDRCDTTSGGHAGCSIKFDRYWSKALGNGSLEIGTNEGNVLHDDRFPDRDQLCRNGRDPAVIATCSTARHFVAVTYLESTVGGSSCWHVGGALWGGTGEQPSELDGDVDRASSVGDSWVFHFLARSQPDAAVTLSFDRRAPAAALEIGGEREPCIAFSLSR